MRMPITQDASASAFQIMSYFLLDERMARKTNLIQSPKGEIQDIYTSILCELKSYIEKKVEDSTLSSTLGLVLDRKIVKSIFMPIIYGKTVMSTAHDIKGNLSRFLTQKECFMVAKLCFEFWKDRFHNMECLIRLIRSIGWIASSSGRSVLYEVDHFTTIQDYVKMEAINIWVYDRLHKKRRQVTLRVASDTRDSRKTEISTFVNFIHQKDAHIAMKVVEQMLFCKAPIYTVHDNFITTSYHSKKIASIYSSAIMSLGHPLKIINQFIYLNVIKPIFDKANIEISDCLIEQVIPKDSFMYYLEENIPEDISRSKTKRKIWDERIKTIVNSYEAYTRLVCGQYENPEDGWSLHHKKYEHFIDMMKRKPGIPIYSVHY
jgi:DNA-directed RNA polymerase